MCFGQIPTTVVVSQMNAPGFGVAKVNGRDTLAVGVALTFTFLDQNGDPVIGSVTESISGNVIQATGATPLDANGRSSDLVSNTTGFVPVKGNVAQGQDALNKLNADFP